MSRKIKRKPQAVANNTVTTENSASRTKRIIIIAVSALLGAAILFGAILGITLAVKNASYYAYVDGVGIDRGVSNYLVSYFKAKYKAELTARLGESGNVTDVPAFWNQKTHPDVATTYGDLLKLYVENEIRYLLAANSLFDKNFDMTYEHRAEVAVATNEILEFMHGGDIAAFNEEAQKYGFDFDDFKKATEMLYKRNFLGVTLFGYDGGGISKDAEFCESFFAGYTRASFLFIRTDNTYTYDADGNKITDSDGKYVTRPLDEEERAERAADIEKLQGIIDGKYELALYDDIWQKYAKENNEELYSCYFTDGSALKVDLASKYSAVVSAAEGAEVLSITRVDDSKSDDGNSFIGSCFIYRFELEEGKYKEKDDAGYFDDFYSLAASKKLDDLITELLERVEIRAAWSRIDPITLPYNSTYVVRGF